MRKIILAKLGEGLPAITPAFGLTLAEAGAIYFVDQNHKNGVELKVRGAFAGIFKVYWPKVTEQMLRCWNDYEFTTEQAAYGVAILLIRDLTKYTVIRRSRKGLGFDYWLGYTNDEGDDLRLEDKARLEVSGIRQGNQHLVKKRMKQKIQQVEQANHLNLPAYIVVVEFSTPMSQLEQK